MLNSFYNSIQDLAFEYPLQISVKPFEEFQSQTYPFKQFKTMSNKKLNIKSHLYPISQKFA